MLDEYEVLNYVYKNANMGKESTKTLLKSLEGKDNKIINAVIDILNSYEKKNTCNLTLIFNENNYIVYLRGEIYVATINR